MSSAHSHPPDHYAAPNLSATGRGWRWLAAAAIFGNIFLNYYSNTHPLNGQTMGTVSAKYPTLLTPAGYAFSIWGLIFLGLVVYAVWQLLPAQRLLSLPDALAKPLALANVATGAWVVLFAYELIQPSVGVMLVILGTLIAAYGRARRRVLAGAAPAWASLPVALYLGWISVASVINVTIGLQQLGWQPVQGGAIVLALVLLVVVVALGLLVARVFQEMAFPLVMAWALVAIWVVRLREVPELGWAALAGAAVVAIGGVALSRVGGRRQPWEIATAAAEAQNAALARSRTAAEAAAASQKPA
ncbi:tryptophan-rich sensory protein [Hymenobacter nivis]|uniref:Tryptophan-rich sensory protein n=1 Tax=Hymenobacter nivis TaxID=1850093 RepID=A0A502GMR4_9BACT|nr:tryptophan-rich sensory protein [Hymenobacter nivis]TPG62276.1 tryptophan-rich sensory protein [Hymenobacter nivis]